MEDNMLKAYGIDFGTTYSVIATLDDCGMPAVIENPDEGSLTLTSAVYFPKDGEPVVGEFAKTQAELEPERVVQFILREIGKDDSRIYEFNGIKYDPIIVCALILKRMKEYAEFQCFDDVKDIVLAVPVYYGVKELTALKQAAVIAGMNVLGAVNAPTAAALYYCGHTDFAGKQSRRVLVYDLGGGTFDAALLECREDDNGKADIRVIDFGGDAILGGIDWDIRLYEHICELYCDECGLPGEQIDSDLRAIIRSAAENTKKLLSNKYTHSFNIAYCGDVSRIEVSAEKFEELTKDLVDRTIYIVHQLLSSNSLSPDDIDVVLLAGGSTRMPMIRKAVDKSFPGKVLVDEPQFAVAKGAVLAADAFSNSEDLKWRRHGDIKQTDNTGDNKIRHFESASIHTDNNPALTANYNKFDLFDLTQLPFDPPNKVSQIVKRAIEKAKKDLNNALAVTVLSLERDAVEKKLAFLYAQASEIFTEDGKLTSRYDELARERTEKETEKLKTTVALIKESGRKSIANGIIRILCQKTRLSEGSVKKVFVEFGFIINDANPLVAYPIFPANIENIYTELEALRNAKDPNPKGKDLTLIVDLYAFTAYLCGESGNEAEYRSKSASELASLLDRFSKQFSTRSDDLGRLCASLAVKGKLYVFNTDENRKAYDSHLLYKCKELIELFNALKVVPAYFLYDTQFAESCVRRIMQIFNNYDTSLAIYNKEAGLRNAPYIPMNHQVSNAD
jgi:actin-like ATPase involved in cell morphogenesis